MSGRMRTGKLVGAFLADLGSNGTQVAARLTRLGVTGVPHNQCECPVARLLSTAVASDPAIVRVRVRNRYAIVTRVMGWPWIPVRLPAAICEFVGAFDAGRHPQLVQVDPPARTGTAAA